MYISPEAITTIVGTVTVIFAILGGCVWFDHRIGNVERNPGTRMKGVNANIDARLDDFQDKSGARVDGVERNLGARIDKVADELVEVKVAIARIEGQPRHHVSTR
ncbi:hypothetical protein [Microbacterium sp. KRD172]|uniref:hypothetical protein n=1 Tax=Microbacterium sp. KRD172 TaxID=2729727 RepID=UPI0019D0B10D|nr:hypothetical protein [Microbacterium sp. KRD172]